MFFSDNGGPVNSNASINAPLRGQKSLVLDGGVRVPFIFSWPGTLPAGRTYKQPFISLDLLPTFLAAAGIDRRQSGEPEEARSMASTWHTLPSRARRGTNVRTRRFTGAS